MIVRALTEPLDLLGEGVLWDEEQQAVYWVDIARRRLRSLGPGGKLRRWALPAKIGSFALEANGDAALVALATGLHRFDLASGALEFLVDPEPGQRTQRLNDGCCDPQGRFWVGSMDDAERERRGHFYCFDPAEGSLRTLEAGFLVTNGIGFDRAGTRMYAVDSAERRIYVHDYDPDTGTPGPRRLFALVPEDEGYPDGLTLDDEDHVWSCHWDGWCVTRYRPDGSVERVVELPIPRPTRCAFGGPNRDRLYVTSARIGLGPEFLERAPLSGAVLEIEGLGVRGPGARRLGRCHAWT